VDHVHGFRSIRQLYLTRHPDYTGRFTVPVLYDKKTRQIVNNESSEIIRMFNGEFNEFAKHPDIDLYPPSLRTAIDRWNERLYETVNNGVYRCGFARTQEAYEEAFHELFAALDEVEHHLGSNRYLCGDALTEADIRLFVTIIRFDAVYVTHFKTNKKRIIDYPNLLGWTRDVYQRPRIAETVNFFHIKQHYFRSHPSINPFGIVPLGPELPDYTAPHGRDAITSKK